MFNRLSNQNKQINQFTMQKQFDDIITLIKQSRTNAFKAVNSELIALYWSIGEYIYTRLESAEWSESVVKELAGYLQRNEPNLKGFSDKNLWRMKQFFEAYRSFPKLSTLSREISHETSHPGRQTPPLKNKIQYA